MLIHGDPDALLGSTAAAIREQSAPDPGGLIIFTSPYKNIFLCLNVSSLFVTLPQMLFSLVLIVAPSFLPKESDAAAL